MHSAHSAARKRHKCKSATLLLQEPNSTLSQMKRPNNVAFLFLRGCFQSEMILIASAFVFTNFKSTQGLKQSRQRHSNTDKLNESIVFVLDY
jgi:hypothetical protein